MATDHQLREFRHEDLNSLRELIHATIDCCYSGVYPAKAVEFFKEYHSEQHILEDAEKGYTILLEIDGTIIGTGTLLGANIRRVFVHPSWQHKGFGKLIMRILEERAAEEGISVLDLSSSLVSKQFYDSQGYVTEKKDSFPVGNGQKLVYYAMVKKLADATR